MRTNSIQVSRNCLHCGTPIDHKPKQRRYCSYSCSGHVNALLGKVTPVEERFWAKVDKSGECWIWIGTIWQTGYGNFGISKGKTIGAHRFSYELAHGKIKSSRVLVCHKCDNRRCVRPEHLFLGSHKDNTQDALKKGRIAIGERAGAAKITAEQVVEIINYKGKERQDETGERFGISQTQVSRIQSGKHWQHLTNLLLPSDLEQACPSTHNG